jgi:predicted enzyme related to lactoylglutathione lyase
MNISLNRVILFVKNVERLKNFYQQHFNAEPVEEIDNEWAILKAGACEIALHKAGGEYGSRRGPGDNSNVKLVFETDAGLQQWREELINNKVVMKEVVSFGNPGYLYCDGVDPEGNVFQLMQRLP